MALKGCTVVKLQKIETHHTENHKGIHKGICSIKLIRNHRGVIIVNHHLHASKISSHVLIPDKSINVATQRTLNSLEVAARNHDSFSLTTLNV